ncbi:MAG: DUF6263 family protein, partial [Bergeyella zoohelcum]|nr:DUF6263 family protein [Bergeyella zoohelcum]
TSETVDGKTISISTKSAAPKEPQLKIMWAMNKALSGNTLQLKMKDNGEVVSVAGFEAIYTKMDKVATAEIKDAGQRKAFIGGFKQSFNAESFKKQFTNSLIILPKKGAKLGEKWTETENATPDGSVKLSTHYTLKSVENGLVTIVVSGGIPKKTDKQSQNGLTRTLSSELTQSGTMVLDQNTGWVKSQTITTTTNQTETITDGKQTQSMKSQNTAVINVNP